MAVTENDDTQEQGSRKRWGGWQANHWIAVAFGVLALIVVGVGR